MRALNPWQSYRQVATATASKGQLVLMLFDGIVRFLDRSLTGFGLEDPAECNQTVSNNILRAQDIIRELDSSLNMEVGGEISLTLRRLYQYFDRRLLESNVRKDADGIREIIGHVTVLRDAWAAMLQGQGATPDPTSQPSLQLAAA
ncbi:MAG TPA: flagellar export chaperone FliS [Candidatus Limnocylindria bacterium]|jgi:flagellar protein FliS|nr:flagellar export chaperone FliS [Candidatus Limnocylindria bacterium]